VPQNFYFDQPDNAYTNAPTNTIANDAFYYSPHARKVYATRPGVVTVVWKERTSGQLFPQSYVISSSPVKAERKIFWTENGFSGPKVAIPDSRVGGVNIIYNSAFPRIVSTSFVSPYATANPNLNIPEEVRTVWYDPIDKLIHSYNIEGRVFVEYLGNLRADGVTREPLGSRSFARSKKSVPTTLHVEYRRGRRTSAGCERRGQARA
jgi:hypothetical protein